MSYWNEPEEIINQDWCEVIHRLLKDRGRLEQLVIEAREQVNSLALAAGADRIYDLTAENVFNRSYDDMAALKKYAELYGSEAIVD